VHMHIFVFGHPPPRIPDKIMVNLGKVVDCYIEEHFSYIRFFSFLLDRLVCHKVVQQTIINRISKELKAMHKKVWPYFPFPIGSFSLLDFGHSKVEVAALE
jgi:hypothetical protein